MQIRRGLLALAFASIVVETVPLFASEPSAVTTLSSGELAILDATSGIEKVSDKNVRTKLVGSFGIFQAGEFVVLPMTGGDAFFVPLQNRFKAEGQFAHLSRYNSAGQETAAWFLREIGGALGAIAIDSLHQIAYCSDSRLKTIYQLDLKNTRSSFVSLVRIRDAGILGPMVLDAKRGRLLVADVEKGDILSIMLDTGKVEVVKIEVALDHGRIAEPVSMAFDQNNDRLYVADAARSRVWVGTPSGSKWTVRALVVSQQFKQPISVALARDGSLWVMDRGQRKIWLFAIADGKTLRTVVP